MVWSLWSCILYLLGSCGYLALDLTGYFLTVDTWTVYVLYIVLAGIFVIEGILYAIDWCQYACCQQGSQRSIGYYKFKFLASVFHNIGSLAYLLGAIFGGNTNELQPDFLSSPRVYVCNIIGMGALVIEAILSLLGWMLRPPDNQRCHCPHGVPLWANLLNLLGGLTYLTASILSPVLVVVYSATKTQVTIQQNYIQLILIGGDGVYLIDSMLYMVLWIQDRKKHNRSNGERPIGTDARSFRFR